MNQRQRVEQHLSPEVNWELRLFGSRLNDQARGGDIDLYLEVDPMAAAARMSLARKLRPQLEEALDQPVDLVIQSRDAPMKPVSRIARSEGLPLRRRAWGGVGCNPG